MTTLPTGPFSAITADPPWHFRTWSKRNQTRGADQHYALMTLDAIKALPIGAVAARDCALFLWVVDPMLPQAMEVLGAWGFKFKTVAFTWLKLNASAPPMFWVQRDAFKGMGYWTRKGPEQCWLATRGSPKRRAKNVPQTIVAPRRAHSRKPDEAYERIERLVDGPYLELFARTSRKGWTSWGNETERFAEAAE